MRKAFEIDFAGWVMMLGDDNEISDDAFEYFRAILEYKRDYSFIVFNSDENSNRYTESKDYFNHKGNFLELYDRMPYGTVMCNLKYFSLIKNTFEKYMGTHHLYSGVCWETLLKNDKCYFGHKPIIICKSIEKSYRDYLAEVFIVSIPRWYDLLPNEYMELAKAAKFKHLMQIFPNINEEGKLLIIHNNPDFVNYIQSL